MRGANSAEVGLATGREPAFPSQPGSLNPFTKPIRETYVTASFNCTTLGKGRGGGGCCQRRAECCLVAPKPSLLLPAHTCETGKAAAPLRSSVSFQIHDWAENTAVSNRQTAESLQSISRKTSHEKGSGFYFFFSLLGPKVFCSLTS